MRERPVDGPVGRASRTASRFATSSSGSGSARELFLAERGIHRVEHDLPIWTIAEPDKRIALVAHAGTNSVFMCHLLGLQPTPWEWDRFVLGHASVSRIEALEVHGGFTFSLTVAVEPRAHPRPRPHPVSPGYVRGHG